MEVIEMRREFQSVNVADTKYLYSTNKLLHEMNFPLSSNESSWC